MLLRVFQRLGGAGDDAVPEEVAIILYMVGKLAPYSTHCTRKLVK